MNMFTLLRSYFSALQKVDLGITSELRNTNDDYLGPFLNIAKTYEGIIFENEWNWGVSMHVNGSSMVDLSVTDFVILIAQFQDYEEIKERLEKENFVVSNYSDDNPEIRTNTLLVEREIVNGNKHFMAKFLLFLNDDVELSEGEQPYEDDYFDGDLPYNEYGVL